MVLKRGSCFTNIHVCIDTHTQQQSTAVVAIQLMLHIHIDAPRTDNYWVSCCCVSSSSMWDELKVLLDWWTRRDVRMDGWTDQFVYHILWTLLTRDLFTHLQGCIFVLNYFYFISNTWYSTFYSFKCFFLKISIYYYCLTVRSILYISV